MKRLSTLLLPLILLTGWMVTPATAALHSATARHHVASGIGTALRTTTPDYTP